MWNLFANRYLKFKKLSYFFRKDTKPHLGRWNIHHDIFNINSKVDLANEDHCGLCGKYAESKQQLIKDDEKNKKETK